MSIGLFTWQQNQSLVLNNILSLWTWLGYVNMLTSYLVEMWLQFLYCNTMRVEAVSDKFPDLMLRSWTRIQYTRRTGTCFWLPFYASTLHRLCAAGAIMFSLCLSHCPDVPCLGLVHGAGRASPLYFMTYFCRLSQHSVWSYVMSHNPVHLSMTIDQAWAVYRAKRRPMLALAWRSWNKYVITYSGVVYTGYTRVYHSRLRYNLYIHILLRRHHMTVRGLTLSSWFSKPKSVRLSWSSCSLFVPKS